MARHAISLVIGAIATLLVVTVVDGFPNGAPPSACEGDHVPIHGRHRPKPVNTSPYEIIASGKTYSPGTEIIVTISGDTFKGFFMQARDSETHKWIGSFVQTPNIQAYDECASVTHVDHDDKEKATFTWKAPATGSGEVYFHTTIVKNFATFWVALTSKTTN